MAKRLIPSLNRVLVEKLLKPSKSAGGILLPETTKQVKYMDLALFLSLLHLHDLFLFLLYLHPALFVLYMYMYISGHCGSVSSNCIVDLVRGAEIAAGASEGKETASIHSVYLLGKKVLGLFDARLESKSALTIFS
jgi:hypothetical protein